MGVYRMKVIIPLAGPEGGVEKEFKEFKNLIEIYNVPWIKYIADSRPYDLSKAVFLLLGETNKKYNIAARLKGILGSGIEIFILDKPTEGSACSVLTYLEHSKIKEDILIDLADQYLSFDKWFLEFIEKNKDKLTSIIPTFKSRYWKWSYARLDKEGFVEEVQEKVDPPISNDATAAIYYFSSAAIYTQAAKEMIRLDKRVKFNNKFFISCVYNELPRKTVVTFPTRLICPLGSSEGIKIFSQII
jgi:NDP-sugar pyrophosphorylase family protein